MNYQKIYKNDFVNGEGVRTTLFVSGCDHGCPGCYNKTTWNPRGGNPFTEETLEEILEATEPDYISGLSLTGGDPLYEGNRAAIYNILFKFRKKFGDTKNVWMWTGYTLEEVNNDPLMSRIVGLVDVLIDGKFEQDKYDPALAFRGSSNQVIHKFTEF